MAEVTELGFSSGRPTRQLLLVLPELLPEVWPEVEHLFLENAQVWDEYYTLESIQYWLVKNTMQLWTLSDDEEYLLAWITELREYPKVTVLNFPIILGSKLYDNLDLLDCVEMWARKQGATKSCVFGRKGFLRALKPYGYEQKGVTLSKNISHMVEH